MDHELPEVLDGIDEAATLGELEEVVRRAGQRRRASLVAGAAALLVLGGVGGALARGAGPTRVTSLGSRPGAPKPQSPAARKGGGLGWSGGPITPLFRREANGVAIRAYLDPNLKGPCGPGDTVRAELSSAAAVTTAMAPTSLAGPAPTDRVDVLGFGLFGDAEGQPAGWVIALAGDGTAKLRLRVGSASDTMDAPLGTPAVLAVAVGEKDLVTQGVVEALAADGTILRSLPLAAPAPTPAQAAPDPGCVPGPCPSEAPPVGPEATSPVPPDGTKAPGAAVTTASGPARVERVEPGPTGGAATLAEFPPGVVATVMCAGQPALAAPPPTAAGATGASAGPAAPVPAPAEAAAPAATTTTAATAPTASTTTINGSASTTTINGSASTTRPAAAP